MRENPQCFRCGVALGGCHGWAERQEKIEFCPNSLGRRSLGLRQLYSLSEVFDGLCVRGAAEREVTSLEPVIDSRFHKAGFGEVMCHDFRLACHAADKPFLEQASNLTMQLLPPALQKALIGRIPHQRVLEAVCGFRRFAQAVHELGLLEFGERMLQCARVRLSHATMDS